MKSKFIAMNAALHAYVAGHRSHAKDPLLNRLRRETEKLGDISGMLISHEQGSFLTLLTAAIGAREVLEIGTFTGYSAICLARGLSARGHLHCLDINPEWTAIARHYWAKALPRSRKFDLVFIDADKPGYKTYYELVLPRVRRNGLILFDNMLQHGRVVRPRDENARQIDALNKKLRRDRRVECVLLPMADGLMICRKV
jgi:caffeoyl-CoA O-methyltransferase